VSRQGGKGKAEGRESGDVSRLPCTEYARVWRAGSGDDVAKTGQGIAAELLRFFPPFNRRSPRNLQLAEEIRELPTM
jgi:hypothetical protein